MSRRKTNMKGPKTLDEWIEVYEDRGGDDTEFIMNPDETLVWSPENGFFSWCLDAERKIVFAPLLYLAGLALYPWVVVAHLCAYPFYAGEYSDFKWLDGFAGISKRGWMWIDLLVLCGAFWWGIYKIIMKVI